MRDDKGFCYMDLTSLITWIRNQMPSRVYDEITYPLPTSMTAKLSLGMFLVIYLKLI